MTARIAHTPAHLKPHVSAGIPLFDAADLVPVVLAGLLVAGALLAPNFLLGGVAVAGIGVCLAVDGGPALRLPHHEMAGGMAALVLAAGILAGFYGTAITLACVAGIGVALVFVAEMLRADGRLDLLRQLTGTFGIMMAILAGCLWVLAFRVLGDGAAVTTTACALAGATVIRALLGGRLGARLGAEWTGAIVGMLACVAGAAGAVYAGAPLWMGAAGLLAGLLSWVGDVRRNGAPANFATRTAPLAIYGALAYALAAAIA
ncbi:hypothetical protein [Neoactinobaculum massilliense]|uniref:hypothetical protein n=1 Tax=Neoactinobaculum massilliense TaxID=2364794 RepID=UPI000F52FFE6|nr:hypothetical protein [Neoactinobaculum massilliense]